MSALMLFLALAAGLTVFVGLAFWFYRTFLHKPAPPAITVMHRAAPDAWSGKSDSRGLR